MKALVSFLRMYFFMLIVIQLLIFESTRWSVFLNYYNTNVYPNSMNELSWIGSLSLCLRHIMGPLYAWSSSRMDDRYAIALGGLITSLSLMLASITNQVLICKLTCRLLNTHETPIDLAIVDHSRDHAGYWIISGFLSLFESEHGMVFKATCVSCRYSLVMGPSIYKYRHCMLLDFGISLGSSCPWLHFIGIVCYWRHSVHQAQSSIKIICEFA